MCRTGAIKSNRCVSVCDANHRRTMRRVSQPSELRARVCVCVCCRVHTCAYTVEISLLSRWQIVIVDTRRVRLLAAAAAASGGDRSTVAALSGSSDMKIINTFHRHRAADTAGRVWCARCGCRRRRRWHSHAKLFAYLAVKSRPTCYVFVCVCACSCLCFRGGVCAVCDFECVRVRHNNNRCFVVL